MTVRPPCGRGSTQRIGGPLTADTVGTAAGDGTGMLFADWCASDIGDGTPDFTRRDAIIGRTSANIPLLMGPQTGESYYGASLMYITQAVSSGGGASSFADLTGSIADSQVPAAFTRDSELAVYALLAGAVFTGAVSGPVPTADSHLATKAYVDGLVDMAVSDDIYFGTSDDGDTGGCGTHHPRCLGNWYN